MTRKKILLLGCGILKKEVLFLIEKNRWPMETMFLDSALHVDFEKLSHSLTSGLAKHKEENIIVFYGACHPLMEKMLDEASTFRTEGQNCVEMLLGHDLFMEELSKGAFFLIEDWAKRWDYITGKTFGENRAVMREIFQGDRRYLLCLRTPCSEDFSEEAEITAEKVGLPMRWMDVTLDKLEAVLEKAVNLKMKATI